ncbi:MAG: hypothetical protein JEZ03_07700 [Bacteroidales bacterium]|nr:hypothetical protein [Bacteroidales bacterium]
MYSTRIYIQKTQIIILLCLITGFSSFSQRFEIKAFAGASSVNIPDVNAELGHHEFEMTSNTYHTSGTITIGIIELYHVETGIEAGIEMAFFINENLSIESAFGINQINFGKRFLL